MVQNVSVYDAERVCVWYRTCLCMVQNMSVYGTECVCVDTSVTLVSYVLMPSQRQFKLRCDCECVSV